MAPGTGGGTPLDLLHPRTMSSRRGTRRPAEPRPDHLRPAAEMVRVAWHGALVLSLSLAPAAAPAQPRGAAASSTDARGAVVDAETGRPIAGAEVIVTAVGAPEGAAPAAVLRTGEDGAWRTPDLASGAYRVRVRHIGYAFEERTVRLGGAAAGPLRVALAPRAVSLEALVVSANRRIQKLKEVPIAVQLVDRREIEQSGASNVAVLLTEQAGLTIDGGTPSGAGVMLQGLDSKRVLVLLDGQPINGRINGTLDLSRLPTAMVSRVEVVKGPQSTLYGSDAMGGVVNLITRDAGGRTWGGALGMQGGTQGRRELNGSVLGGSGPLSFTADLGRRDVALAPGRDGQVGTESARWDYAAKGRWRIDPALTLEASALGIDEGQQWRTGQTWFFADRTQAAGRLTGTWQRGRTRLQPIVHFTYFDHLFRRSLTDRPLSELGDHDTQRLLVGELIGSHAFTPGRVLDAGVQLRREANESDRVYGDEGTIGTARTRSTVEPYAQLTFGDERWSVVPGARLTADDQWGTHWTPRIAAMYRPVAPLAVRAAAGRGFRAPDFKELYLWFPHVSSEFSYIVRGNPELRPETNDNVSGSVEWAGERLYLRTDAYYNRFTNFIESRIIGDTTLTGSSGTATYFTYGNVGRGVTRGVDLEATLRVSRLRVEGGYGLLDAYDATTGDPLLGRPRHSARLSVNGTPRRGLSATLGGVFTGRTPVTYGDDGEEAWRDAYFRVHARIAQTLDLRRGGQWTLELGSQNLLDARPEYWPGFTGRQVYMGLTWQTGSAITGR